ncbi:hypothetical protein B0I72DRAFT_138695 [Yarrowia lipolytica]|uniref:Secreted protein n=1 Tax=Yarrowia lipolytica TaxID=4952 RepID=A0A371BZ31_YARLL|nr:hypothetical protein BKA91DRAFT_142522 [Yarrowia lipolytica]KAE8169666.1 hypothetical protein BKA90DRAFT_142209 [Yarrowia lipolytica]RDW23366.1 hypothetical protein B0I71DRAFT_136077 [Yarrowia lipolytica]RDW32093.1 hypothetical protein B0I72DRAFT_138695 [Yarrowia lipolytica]RDW37758.1 hypothetical protein B0I73DRAFT_134990 [Yarrowia lipolytica]
MYMAVLVTVLWTILFMTWPRTKHIDPVSTSAQYKLFQIRTASKHGKQRKRFKEHCQNVCGVKRSHQGTIRRRSSRCTDVTRELLMIYENRQECHEHDESLIVEKSRL